MRSLCRLWMESGAYWLVVLFCSHGGWMGLFYSEYPYTSICVSFLLFQPDPSERNRPYFLGKKIWISGADEEAAMDLHIWGCKPLLISSLGTVGTGIDLLLPREPWPVSVPPLCCLRGEDCPWLCMDGQESGGTDAPYKDGLIFRTLCTLPSAVAGTYFACTHWALKQETASILTPFPPNSEQLRSNSLWWAVSVTICDRWYSSRVTTIIPLIPHALPELGHSRITRWTLILFPWIWTYALCHTKKR